MRQRVANNLCVANIPCGDGRGIFAYRQCVARKKRTKAKAKSPEYAKSGAFIRETREALDFTQDTLAEAVGAGSRQVIQSWESGTAMPRRPMMRTLATTLKVTVEEIERGERIQKDPVSASLASFGSPRRVPIISWIAASQFCGSADPYAMGTSEEWVYDVNVGERCFALRVRGPSMQPRFNEGDLIIVDPDREARPGNFVIVARDSTDEATFKQLARVDGELWLKPLNPQFPAIPMPKDARICGVVFRRTEEV